MLVKYVDTRNPTIIIEWEYTNILPILEMIKQKAAINIFLDKEGNKRVNGRLYDYEYIL